MKLSRILTSMTVLTLVATMPTSCSLFKKNSSKTQAQESSVPNLKEIKNGITGPGGSASTQPVKAEPLKIDSDAMKLIDGLWTLRSISGITLSEENGDSDEMRPYINFEASTQKFYASDGCNTINGNYSADANHKLTVDCVLSTMMLCPTSKYDQLFKQGLINTTSFTKEVINHENVLTLYNAKGNKIMTLVRPFTDFLNGAWTVSSINGNRVGNAKVTMVIDIPECKVHGNTGCNIFNGSIFVDPDKDGSIQFQEVAVTRMMCPDIDTETAFLVALEAVEYARSNGKEALLLDAHNKVVLTLTPLDLSAGK